MSLDVSERDKGPYKMIETVSEYIREREREREQRIRGFKAEAMQSSGRRVLLWCRSYP